jgi:uroporphyrinogen-III synthase
MYLLTRPEHKLHKSKVAFAQAGVPVCAIAPFATKGLTKERQQLDDHLADHKPDILIVTSTFAADLLVKQPPNFIPQHIIAIGSSTAKTLADLNRRIITPSHTTSEGLLELPHFQQCDGLRVVVVKGKGGRHLISQTLMNRNAHITECDIYHRVTLNPPVLSSVLNWSDIKGVIATSAEMANALIDLYPHSTIKGLPWLTVSQRVAEHIRTLGVNRVFQSTGASDLALLQWVQQHWE